jgi:outer membrane beta-barrel protein
MLNQNHALALVTALSVFGFAPRAWAVDEEEQAATYAVQNREFSLGHEFQAAVGVLPMNAFTKGVTFGGGYTYHFSDLWAWEAMNFEYVENVDTSLQDQLLQNFQVQPTQIEKIDYFGSTNLVVKPLYGKFAWLNRSVAHAELFGVFGPSMAKYANPSTFRPGFDYGGGIRVHLGSHTSLRVDVRDYVFFKGFSPKQELHVALSAALSFGRDR